MTARYAPRVFPVQVEADFVAQHELRSNGTECPTSTSGYSKSGVHFNGRRPILYDAYDEIRQQATGPAKPHHAMDITCALGSYVVAPNDGRVPLTLVVNGNRVPGSGQSPRGGNYAFILDDDGITHYFAHMLEAARVRPGQRVSANQIIGLCGRSGNATGGCAHLHYATTDASGAKFNPYEALRALYEADGWIRPKSSWPWLALAGAAAGVGWWRWRRRGRRSMNQWP
jgi:murein DD-endopeptidase MepM/ murein hydrolase activator NlpD